MKMIYIVIALVALTWFLLWAYKHEGIPESISSLFYRPKTQWTYTMVISGVGVLMTLVAPKSILHYAGISLILGTAAQIIAIQTPFQNTFTLVLPLSQLF